MRWSYQDAPHSDSQHNSRSEMGIIVSCIEGIFACIGECVVDIIGCIAGCLECIVGGAHDPHHQTRDRVVRRFFFLMESAQR